MYVLPISCGRLLYHKTLRVFYIDHKSDDAVEVNSFSYECYQTLSSPVLEDRVVAIRVTTITIDIDRFQCTTMIITCKSIRESSTEFKQFDWLTWLLPCNKR